MAAGGRPRLATGAAPPVVRRSPWSASWWCCSSTCSGGSAGRTADRNGGQALNLSAVLWDGGYPLPAAFCLAATSRIALPRARSSGDSTGSAGVAAVGFGFGGKIRSHQEPPAGPAERPAPGANPPKSKPTLDLRARSPPKVARSAADMVGSDMSTGTCRLT